MHGSRSTGQALHRSGAPVGLYQSVVELFSTLGSALSREPWALPALHTPVKDAAKCQASSARDA
eukprot:5895845-Amphidinium_carterae.1